MDNKLNVKPVSPSQRLDFRCTRCGACCRHLRESVPLNTLDAFRLAKYLRAQGEEIDCLDSVFVRFAEPVPLHESGYSVYMLKTTGPDDACIFLQNNHCTIQPAKTTCQAQCLPPVSFCGGAKRKWLIFIPSQYGATSPF